MEKIIINIPYASAHEIFEYLQSEEAISKGDFLTESISFEKINANLRRLHQNSNNIFRFECDSGFRYRYGKSKRYLNLKNEPIYLTPKGKLDRCYFCGSILYELNHDEKIHLFKESLKFCKLKSTIDINKDKEIFILGLKNSYAIISKYKIYGIFDKNIKNKKKKNHEKIELKLRLPGKLQEEYNHTKTEFWLINKMARIKKYIPPHRILKLDVQENLLKI
ncbi:MAG: hypothetical protein ACTSXF_02530 [Promethearchaeota archaeon]